jgi:hypothetical protein
MLVVMIVTVRVEQNPFDSVEERLARGKAAELPAAASLGSGGADIVSVEPIHVMEEV